MGASQEGYERAYGEHRATRQDVSPLALDVGGLTVEQLRVVSFASEQARAAQLGLRVLEILREHHRALRAAGHPLTKPRSIAHAAIEAAARSLGLLGETEVRK